MLFSKASFFFFLFASAVAQPNTCPTAEYDPPSGVIESPGFAQHLNYGNDVSCVYNIKVAEGSRVLLTINSFATEMCCDRLYIYDGPSILSPLLIAWSGQMSAGSFIEATGNTVTVNFRSDNTINDVGFSIQYGPTQSQFSQTTTAQPSLQFVDWRDQSIYWNDRPSPTDIHALVLHHTVELTAQATLDTLINRQLSVHYIAGRNGTIYQMVDERNRAWHAGYGTWGDFHDLNDVSIGIEIVNSGAEPFPVVQEEAVAALSRMIINRWNILPKNIVSHADFQMATKTDVSGYFDYKLFYAALGIYPGLYVSNLPVSEQTRVLYQQSSTYNSAVKTLQQQLSQYGFALSINGIYDNQTGLVAEAFNRHYCPEVFIKEQVVDGNDIRFPQNRQWYGISQERLTYLIAHS